MQVQTRSVKGELRYFITLREAMEYANNPDNKVWKVSFPWENERVRLVRQSSESPKHSDSHQWVYASITDAISELLNTLHQRKNPKTAEGLGENHQRRKE